LIIGGIANAAAPLCVAPCRIKPSHPPEADALLLWGVSAFLFSVAGFQFFRHRFARRFTDAWVLIRMIRDVGQLAGGGCWLLVVAEPKPESRPPDTDSLPLFEPARALRKCARLHTAKSPA